MKPSLLADLEGRKSVNRDWIGTVPQDWDSALLKLVARLESGHTPSRSVPEYWQDCTIPWFSLADVWQLREGRRKYVFETAEKVSELGIAKSSARILPAGTVMLSRTASVGFTGIMGQDMATTQDFVNWVCGEKLVPEYLWYCMQAMAPEYDRLRFGSTHQTIYMPDVAQFKVPVPPKGAQERITNFLDEQTARIDALISEKERLVELLREEEQACIDRAVFGGLRPSITFPFTPATGTENGVLWSQCALKRHWTVTDCKHLTVEFVGDGRPLASIREVSGGVLDLSSAKKASEADYLSLIEGGRRPMKGDLIYARNASVGAAALVDLDEPFAMGQDVCLISSVNADQQFLRLQLLSSPLRAQLESLLVGATIRRINVEQIRNFMVLVPPQAVQRQVVTEVGKTLAARSQLRDHVSLHIDRLREYRSSLISAAVTGQLDISTFKAAA